MTHKQVKKFLITLFKDVNAVDPHLSDSEIAETLLPDLAWFDGEMDNDPDFKKEALFRLVVKKFKDKFNGIEPVIVPFNGGVFDRDITVSELAKEIADDT